MEKDGKEREERGVRTIGARERWEIKGIDRGEKDRT